MYSWWSEDDTVDEDLLLDGKPDLPLEIQMKIKEKKIYYELYEKKFGKIKHIPIGIECQVDPKNIPLITDLLDNPQI